MQASGKIVLGTVQFGLEYGISNRAGKPSDTEVHDILDLARDSGITLLDSAEAYGDAHERIGKYHRSAGKKFSVITKFSPGRKDLPSNWNERIRSIIAVLHVDRLYAYMFHSFSDYRTYLPDHLTEISQLKAEGLIRKLGVSVYTSEECEAVIADENIDLIQLPFNLLDNLSQRGEVIEAARRRGVEIHTRSAFLQGLFFRDPGHFPGRLLKLAPYVRQLAQIAGAQELDIGTLALGYAVQAPVDKVLIGVDTAAQLRENLERVEKEIPEGVIRQVDSIAVKETELLNPANWSKVKVLAITQARTGSTRLPGKVLKEVNGETLLKIHLRRLMMSQRIDQLLVATTTEEADEAIAGVAVELGLPAYRGSVNNVLERFYEAAKPYHAEWVVRITSDCPLADAALIDQLIDKAMALGVDYCSNTLEPTFPDGMDVEVFRFGALERAFREATTVSDKEHVTPYIYRNADLKGGKLFTAVNFSADKDYSSVRLTVDEPADLEVIRKLIARLGAGSDWKTYAEAYLTDAGIHGLNDNINRNEGFYRDINK